MPIGRAKPIAGAKSSAQVATSPADSSCCPVWAQHSVLPVIPTALGWGAMLLLEPLKLDFA
jgi:hypothetical protein